MEEKLRKVALALADVREEVACKGTAVESPVYRVGKKSFLFAGKKDIRLKLVESFSEAQKLAAKEPDHYQASMGWVTIRLAQGDPPMEMLKRWVKESYQSSLEKPKAKKPRAAR